MRKILTFCMSTLLCAGILFAPAGFAADKFVFSATELFDPFNLLGSGPVGYPPVTDPVIKCPGYEPTGDPMQPCPAGSRTHIRDFQIVSYVDSQDIRIAGWMTVNINANFDAGFAGPVWGTASIVLDNGGTWEGTWQGLRMAEEGQWVANLNVRAKGYGGLVDGMNLMAEDQIFSFTPVPIAYFGFIQGRVVDPN